jgi:hypothetical protein
MKYKKYIWIFFIFAITAVVYYIRKQKAVEGFMTEDEFVTEANHRIKTMQAIKASINDSLNAFDKSAKETCDLTPKYRDAYVSATADMPKYNSLTNDDRQKRARTEYDEQRINYIASGTPIYECFATQDEVYTATQKLKSEIKELSDLLESPRLRIMIQKGKLLTGLQNLNSTFSGSKMVFESFVVNEDLIESADTLIKLAREIQTVSRTVVINTSRLSTDLVNIPTYVRNRYTEQNRQKYKSKIYSDLINDDIVTQLLGPNNYLQLLYKASRDGYKTNTFHQKADNQGPTLTVFRTNNGRIAGGYNPISWRSVGGWVNIDKGKAFLFNVIGNTVNKFYNTRYTDYSILDSSNHFPFFGEGYDLRFYEDTTVTSSSSTYLNNNSELFGTNNTKVSDIEVFKVT